MTIILHGHCTEAHSGKEWGLSPPPPLDQWTLLNSGDFQTPLGSENPLTNSTNFLNPYSLINYFQSNPNSVSRNSPHQPSFICIHLNQHSYMHIVCIFNNNEFNMCYTLYNYQFTCYKTVKVKLLFIKKSRIYWHWF